MKLSAIRSLYASQSEKREGVSLSIMGQLNINLSTTFKQIKSVNEVFLFAKFGLALLDVSIVSGKQGLNRLRAW